jgi:hypothetical protein
MAVDFMGVKRICAKCKSPDETVAWSSVFACYICDSCYTDTCDALEDERALEDKSNETQSPSSAPSAR